VGVRPEHSGDAPVEVPAERDLLARRLGVHVDEDLIGLAAQIREHAVDLGKRRAPRAHVEVPRQVHDRQSNPVALEHDAAATGLPAEEVRRTDHSLVPVEVGIDLAAAVGVVAERDRVDARFEQLVGNLRRDAEAAGDVLGVDDDEGRREALA